MLKKNSKRFPLEGGALKKKPHLVKWLIACMTKKEGGLGIRNLFIINVALLGKWSWRFSSQKKSMVLSNNLEIWGRRRMVFQVVKGRFWCGSTECH